MLYLLFDAIWTYIYIYKSYTYAILIKLDVVMRAAIPDSIVVYAVLVIIIGL